MNIEGSVVDQIVRNFEERSGLTGIQTEFRDRGGNSVLPPESRESKRAALRNSRANPKRPRDRKIRCTCRYVD